MSLTVFVAHSGKTLYLECTSDTRYVRYFENFNSLEADISRLSESLRWSKLLRP